MKKFVVAFVASTVLSGTAWAQDIVDTAVSALC